MFVKLPAKAMEEGIAKWYPILVGQFLDRQPPFFFVKRAVENIWSQFGKVEVFSMENEMFISRFQDEKDYG